jgi:hypothetical protein
MKFGPGILALLTACLVISPAAPAQTREPVQQSLPGPVMFQRYIDQTERAFACLIPRGWRIKGGILRLTPGITGGPANATEAKFNFWIMSPKGRVKLHWAPHYYFIDPRYSPILRNFKGRGYYGMPVKALMSPQQFAVKMVFPRVHPAGSVSGARLAGQKNLPRLAALFQQHQLRIMHGRDLGVRYHAGLVLVTYTEGGVNYLELIMVVIEDRGKMVNGQWTNRFTFVLRAPRSQFLRWLPIVSEIGRSFDLNPAWAIREMRSANIRGKYAYAIQQRIHQIGREIVEHQRRTNEIIRRQAYTTLTGRVFETDGTFTDPFTGKKVKGSTYWKYRWQDANGNVIYSNSRNYKPGGGFKLTRQGG